MYKNKKTGIESKYFGCSNYRKYGRIKAKGCNTPIIHYEELVDIFRKIANTLLDKESDVIKEIYNLINKIKIKTDYTKEINDIDKKKEKTIEIDRRRTRRCKRATLWPIIFKKMARVSQMAKSYL